MKGFSHFTLGIMSVSFFPEIVRAAYNGSFIFPIAGACGLLSDTLDFKFTRFFENPDINYEPDVENLDGQALAQMLASAVDSAWEKKIGEEVRVQLHTVQMGPDRWRQYSVFFDPDKNEVRAEFGPIVSGFGKTPLPDTEPKDPSSKGSAKPRAKIINPNPRDISATILSGPSFSLKRRRNGVEVIFIPWHRQWSHSFTLAILLGLLGYLLGGGIWAIALGLPVFTHVLADLTGFLGGNLFPPFTKERSAGLKLFHADTPLANFFGVWGAILITLFNLNRFAPKPVFHINFLFYFAIFWVLPFAIALLFSALVEKEELEEETEEEEEEEESTIMG